MLDPKRQMLRERPLVMSALGLGHSHHSCLDLRQEKLRPVKLSPADRHRVARQQCGTPARPPL
eukprot:scaffold97110_cov70-Phaeocystis_antarctica.AAC.1